MDLGNILEGNGGATGIWNCGYLPDPTIQEAAASSAHSLPSLGGCQNGNILRGGLEQSKMMCL